MRISVPACVLQVASACILACVVTGALHAQQDRVLKPIDRSRTVPLKSHINPAVRSEDDRGPVEPWLEISYATLFLKPTLAQQSALEKLLIDQQDPASVEYHRWLTPEEYADRFGFSRWDISQITDWLESQGIKINDVARGRHWITFSGSAAAVGRSFGIELHRYQTDGKLHFANVTTPSIPEALAAVVADIQGLDDFYPLPAGSRHQSGLIPEITSNSGDHYLGPDDIATIYDLKPLYAAGFDGAGQTIAIIGQTDMDLVQFQTYRTRFNLPAKDPEMMLVGPDPGMTPGDEQYLDIEMVSAVARHANVVYVYGKNGFTAHQYAVDQRVATVITESLALCEPATTPVQRAVAQQAAAQGITWVAASGDTGAAGCETQGKLPQASKGMAVAIPASLPEVTGVGGTEFDDAGATYWNGTNTSTLASATSYIPEKAWNDTSSGLEWALGGSTGGASIFFSKPPWQTGAGVPSDHARDVPDIALNASWSHDPYYIYAAGRWYGQAGTSAATPVFASFVAILNQYLVSKGALSQPGLGNINPALFRLAQIAPSAFHDIVQGDNIMPCIVGTPDCVTGWFGFTAGPGYDQVTGLGSVDMYKLATSWDSGTPTTTVVAASPASVTFNSSVRLTATVSAKGSTPSGEVAFLAGDVSLCSATLSGSSASITISATVLSAGSNTITAVYGGAANWNSSAGTMAVTVSVPSGVSAVVASISSNPVYELPPDASGTRWNYTITLTNESAIAGTLTKFTIDGSDDFANLKNALGTATIGANQSLSATLTARNLNAPVNRVFAFTGTDASGATWSQQLTIQFVSRVLETMSVLVTTPATVPSNSAADSSCRWAQPIILEEQGGYDLQLSELRSEEADFSRQLQQLFGTTTIAPFGRLQGTLCWPAATSAGSKTITLTFSSTASQNPSLHTASVSTVLGTPAASVPTVSISPTLVSFSSGASAQKAAVNLSFSSGTPAWTARVSPQNNTTSWLAVSPASGTGVAQLTLTASSAGMGTGVHNATLLIESASASPQFATVPVVLVIGGSSTINIGAVTSAASYSTPPLAPGMYMTVWGTNLSPGQQHAPAVPLPFKMQGVTATVNGIPAPLLDVLPTQLNVQIPYETGAGTAILGINNNGQVAYYAFEVRASAPGIFMTLDGASNLVPNATGKRGDLLLAFITGEGDVTPALMTGRTPTTSDIATMPVPGLPLTLAVGGVPATIYFSAIPSGLVGVTQINFAIPPNAPLGKQPVVVTVGAASSPPVNLTVIQ